MKLREIIAQKETSIILVIVALSALITLANPTFLTYANLVDILRSYAVHGIVAMGMLLVILSAGIDVSVGSMTAAVAVVIGTFLVTVGGNFLLVLLVAVGSGIVFGLFNGFFISKLKIPAIVVTLGSLSIFRGAELYATGGSWITGLPEWFLQFGRISWLGIPIQVYVWLISGVVTYFLLYYTRIGRGVYAIGGNLEAARRVGFRSERLILFIWAYLGFMVGLAALMATSIYKHVDPNGFVFFELTVIAATVLGGANIMGGEGSVLGTFLGVLTLAIVENGLILARIPSYWHQVIVGGVILLAVTVDVVQVKRRERKLARIFVEGEEAQS
jgi:simple sugar transport system permease protein/ribose transport system permease protein